jgi:hypothetical protein
LINPNIQNSSLGTTFFLSYSADQIQKLSELLEKESASRQALEQEVKQAAIRVDVLSNFFGQDKASTVG